MFKFSEPWHRRLAGFYGPLNLDDYCDTTVDFCKYFWACARGTFSVLGILVISSFPSYLVADFLAWLTYISLNSFISPGPGAEVFILLVSAITIISSLGVLVYYGIKPMMASLKEMANSVKEDPVNHLVAAKTFSFFGTWYHSFKNKVCVPVTLKATKSWEDE